MTRCYPIIRHALNAYARSFHRHAAAHIVVSVVCVATGGIGALMAVPAIEMDTLPMVHEAPGYGHASGEGAVLRHAVLNVPEPSSLAVFAVGLVVYAVWRLSLVHRGERQNDQDR